MAGNAKNMRMATIWTDVLLCGARRCSGVLYGCPPAGTARRRCGARSGGFILPGGAAEAFRTELSEDVAASARNPPHRRRAPQQTCRQLVQQAGLLLRVVRDLANGHRDSPEMSISNSGIQYENMWVKTQTNTTISTLLRNWPSNRQSK